MSIGGPDDAFDLDLATATLTADGNDIEMLQWAGRGVAMGQASDDVQAAADHVTASVHDDGVARELERWF